MAFRLNRLLAESSACASIRAVFLLTLGMVFAVLVISVALVLDLRVREIEHARATLDGVSRVLAEQSARTFDGVALSMRAARERMGDEVGRRFEPESLLVHYMLQSRAAGLPQVKSIFIADREGRTLNSSRADFIRDLSLAERTLFRYHAEGGEDDLFISGAEQARIDGQWTFYVSIPVRDPDGSFGGIIGAAIDIGYFEALYRAINMKAVGQVLLLDRDGARLAGVPYDISRYGRIDGEQAAIRKVSTRANGGRVEVERNLPDGRQLVVYRPVASYPLAIGVAVAEDEALLPWRHVVRPIAIGAVLVILLVLSTALLLMRNLYRKALLETTLKERDAQLRHMIKSVSDAIVTADASRRIVLFNDAAARLLGIGVQDAIGQALPALLSQCVGEDGRERLLARIDEAWRGPASFAVLTDIELQRDGHGLPVEISLSTSVFNGEVMLTVVFRDLTESQLAERELLDANRQLQALSASLQSVREEERSRIARELHDELGQSLTGIRMGVSWLGGWLPRERKDLLESVDSIKGQIDDTISTVRRISSELRPLVLDDLGLSAAASWYANQFSERTGTTVNLDLPDQDPLPGGEVATALFRVLQESLTNVARHAGATLAEVSLVLDRVRRQWVLRVVDDGRGFRYDPGRRDGLGLIGMRERIQILGGEFAVRTAPGSGTCIEARVPLEVDDETCGMGETP